MTQLSITEKDRKLAQNCLECPICNRAREKQSGIAYWFVKYIDRKICPACKSYEKVYEVKAYEPVPFEA